jgi:hypothetical protein
MSGSLQIIVETSTSAHGLCHSTRDFVTLSNTAGSFSRTLQVRQHVGHVSSRPRQDSELITVVVKFEGAVQNK